MSTEEDFLYQSSLRGNWFNSAALWAGDWRGFKQIS